MTARKGLVLDANILLRAVFGQRVRQILEAYEDQANFYAPDVCFQDARKYIPDLSTRRRFDVDLALSVLDRISLIVEPVDRSLYEDYQEVARARVLPRDPDDWSVAAVALLLGLPIWTEDQDFFGSGIANWTTDRVELFLREV
jgi:predicted nucleic acid-binding protein